MTDTHDEALDDDGLDDIDFPPELQFTVENILRDLAESDADIAAGRTVPVEDVLRRLDRHLAQARATRLAKTAAE